LTYKFTTFEDVAATRPVHAGAESAGTDAVRPRYCALGPVDAAAANPIRPNRSPPLLPLPSAAFFFFLLLPRCSFFAARPAAASSSPPPVPAPRWPCPLAFRDGLKVCTLNSATRCAMIQFALDLGLDIMDAEFVLGLCIPGMIVFHCFFGF